MPASSLKFVCAPRKPVSPDRKQFNCRSFFGLSVAGMILAAPALAGRQHQAKTDANAIVRQMVGVYQHAASIQETSAASFADNKGIKLSQTYILKYQQPNKFAIISQDPQNGTLAAYSNGRIVRFYSGTRRAYIEKPSASDLAGNVALVGQLAQRLTGSGFDQSLNPISFLLAQSIPREGGSFQFGGVKTVDGHKAYIVTGMANEAWAQSILPGGKGKLTVREITLFIDANTHLLVRASAQLGWLLNSPPQGKKPGASKKYVISFEETHYGTTLNRPINEAEFSFTPPKDVLLKQ